MKNLLARGGIEFLAVFLGIGFSLYVDQWREESEIKDRLLGDYEAIQNDLATDMPYLEEIIRDWELNVNDCRTCLEMLNDDSNFEYEKFIHFETNQGRGASGTFYGTKAAYQAAISSGRLTYFGTDQLANEIGKLYEHHYARLAENGEAFTSYFLHENIKIIDDERFMDDLIKKQNIAIIKSYEYYIDNRLNCFISSWILTLMKRAMNQMVIVDDLLTKQISNM